MASLTDHLIRRGLEELETSLRNAPDAQKEQLHVSRWVLMICVVTALIFAFGQFAIQYTYGELIATLAAVEAPSSTAIVRTPPVESEDSEHPDAPLLSVSEKTDVKEPQDLELLLIKQRALTSRFCTIKRHLKARGGRGSRFRGVAIYGMNSLLYSIILWFFSVSINRGSYLYTVIEILAYTLVTPLELLWNHVVISEPSQKSWRQRMAPRSIIKKALFPTFLYACITKISAQGFIHACLKLDIDPEAFQSSTISQQPLSQVPLSLIMVILLGLFLFIGVQVPAEIAIARVRASLLSAEEEPIIPFDRSFDGQVIPTEQGGSGMLDLWQAWTGCDMQTRLRVLGVYTKVFAMKLSWLLLGALVLLGELRLILGPDFIKKLTLDLVVRT